MPALRERSATRVKSTHPHGRHVLNGMAQGVRGFPYGVPHLIPHAPRPVRDLGRRHPDVALAALAAAAAAALATAAAAATTSRNGISRDSVRVTGKGGVFNTVSEVTNTRRGVFSVLIFNTAVVHTELANTLQPVVLLINTGRTKTQRW